MFSELSLETLVIIISSNTAKIRDCWDYWISLKKLKKSSPRLARTLADRSRPLDEPAIVNLSDNGVVCTGDTGRCSEDT